MKRIVLITIIALLVGIPVIKGVNSLLEKHSGVNSHIESGNKIHKHQEEKRENEIQKSIPRKDKEEPKEPAPRESDAPAPVWKI